MTIYSPYTYLIGWSKLDKWYYGVRFAKKSYCLYESGCHPDELWVTYFTSSETVDLYRKTYGEPDVVEVRKRFNIKESAIEWENKVLKRIGAANNLRFLNKTENKSFPHSIECIQKGTAKMKQTKASKEWKETVGKEASKKMAKNIDYVSLANKAKQTKASKEWKETVGKKATEKRMQKMNYSDTGNKIRQTMLSKEWKETVGYETKKRQIETVLSEEWKKLNFKQCSYCSKLAGPGNFARWHGENCKHNAK
jgi:hypothetical protein